jgi:hypothetical protein
MNRPKFDVKRGFLAKHAKLFFDLGWTKQSFEKIKHSPAAILTSSKAMGACEAIADGNLARIGGGQRAGPAIFFDFLKLRSDVAQRRHRFAFCSYTKRSRKKNSRFFLRLCSKKRIRQEDSVHVL